MKLALGALTALLGLTACTSGAAPPRSSITPGTSTASSVSAAPSPSSSTPAPSPHPTTSASTVPPLGAAARAAGLLDVRSVVPDAIIDLRYATTDNFTRTQLYPSNARCLISEVMAQPLRVAADHLRGEGYRLVFWDCYRPHAVQVAMYRIVPNPEWVARPGDYATSHESARSVDVTLVYVHRSCPATQQVQGLCFVDMGTGFDDFTPRAYAFATQGVSSAEQANRATLRHAMGSDGLTVYAGEWWHFDGEGARVHMPILDVPVTG